MKDVKEDMNSSTILEKKLREPNQNILDNSKLMTYVNNEYLSDIVLYDDKKEKMYGHKIILSTNSFFKKLIEKDHDLKSIDLDVKRDYLMLIIEYIYTNRINIENINESNIVGKINL
jgi:hypothetical protein